MTRARTAAQKRRDKRSARQATITLAGGEKAPQRPTGRDRRHINQKERNPMQTVLEARARHTGRSVEEVRDPLYGYEIGMCIAAMIPVQNERIKLESTYTHIAASKRNWQQRYAGTSSDPQSAAIAMIPEQMQTDDSATIDIRDPEEKDADAKRSWYSWLDDLMKLPADQRHALRGHIDKYALPLWNEDELRPTHTGAMAVKALQSLHAMREQK